MIALIVLIYLGGSVSARSRIIGGESTTTAEHPHQVSLLRQGSHSCGGSIIGEYWVLTAAHCVQENVEDYSIEINGGTRGVNARVVPVDSVTYHPDYNVGEGAYPNDVAVLRMKDSMTTGTVKGEIITMANSQSNFDGQTCVITGWGLTFPVIGSPSPQLQKTDGTILTDAQCTAEWGASYVGRAHICIANPNTGACSGDSGGPMVCGGILAGVTSWGAALCSTSAPSVYARISSYRDWIDAAMR